MSGWSYKENSDKYAHFAIGMGLAGIGLLVSNYTGIDKTFCMLWVGFLNAGAKELWDYFGYGTTEFNDFNATVCGAAFIVLLLSIGDIA